MKTLSKKLLFAAAAGAALGWAGLAQADDAADSAIALSPLRPPAARPFVEPFTSMLNFLSGFVIPSAWEQPRPPALQSTDRSSAPLPAATLAQAYGPAVATPSSGQPQNPDLSAGVPPGSLTNTLEVSETTMHIRQTLQQQRNTMLASLEKRILATYAATARFQIAARKLNDKERADFDAAMKDVQMKELAVETSLKAARRSDSETWPDARDRLASDYEAYANAITRAENSSTALQGNENSM